MTELASTTPVSQPSAQEFFKGVLSILEQQFKSLTPTEVKVSGPSLVNFFSWLEQNPSAVLNPVVIGPKLMILKISLLSDQTTVATDLVQSTAKDMVTLLQTMMKQTG